MQNAGSNRWQKGIQAVSVKVIFLSPAHSHSGDGDSSSLDDAFSSPWYAVFLHCNIKLLLIIYLMLDDEDERRKKPNYLFNIYKYPCQD